MTCRKSSYLQQLKADEGSDGSAWSDYQIVEALKVSCSTVERLQSSSVVSTAHMDCPRTLPETLPRGCALGHEQLAELPVVAQPSGIVRHACTDIVVDLAAKRRNFLRWTIAIEGTYQGRLAESS